MTSMLNDLLFFFFPKTCASCMKPLGRMEQLVCIPCLHTLPFTGFCNQEFNELEEMMTSRLNIASATSLFYFTKDSAVQQMMHRLKYNGMQQIGQICGHWLGASMKTSGRFSKPDLIIPVPLDIKKFRRRGYNQVELFGKSLAHVFDASFDKNTLERRHAQKSQSTQGRANRWSNVASAFHIRNREHLINKNILLVDDIITTGATLESCLQAFEGIAGIQISIASIAYTK